MLSSLNTGSAEQAEKVLAKEIQSGIEALTKRVSGWVANIARGAPIPLDAATADQHSVVESADSYGAILSAVKQISDVAQNLVHCTQEGSRNLSPGACSVLRVAAIMSWNTFHDVFHDRLPTLSVGAAGACPTLLLEPNVAVVRYELRALTAHLFFTSLTRGTSGTTIARNDIVQDLKGALQCSRMFLTVVRDALACIERLAQGEATTVATKEWALPCAESWLHRTRLLVQAVAKYVFWLPSNAPVTEWNARGTDGAVPDSDLLIPTWISVVSEHFWLSLHISIALSQRDGHHSHSALRTHMGEFCATAVSAFAFFAHHRHHSEVPSFVHIVVSTIHDWTNATEVESPQFLAMRSVDCTASVTSFLSGACEALAGALHALQFAENSRSATVTVDPASVAPSSTTLRIDNRALMTDVIVLLAHCAHKGGDYSRVIEVLNAPSNAFHLFHFVSPSPATAFAALLHFRASVGLGLSKESIAASFARLLQQADTPVDGLLERCVQEWVARDSEAESLAAAALDAAAVSAETANGDQHTLREAQATVFRGALFAILCKQIQQALNELDSVPDVNLGTQRITVDLPSDVISSPAAAHVSHSQSLRGTVSAVPELVMRVLDVVSRIARGVAARPRDLEIAIHGRRCLLGLWTLGAQFLQSVVDSSNEMQDCPRKDLAPSIVAERLQHAETCLSAACDLFSSFVGDSREAIQVRGALVRCQTVLGRWYRSCLQCEEEKQPSDSRGDSGCHGEQVALACFRRALATAQAAQSLDAGVPYGYLYVLRALCHLRDWRGARAALHQLCRCSPMEEVRDVLHDIACHILEAEREEPFQVFGVGEQGGIVQETCGSKHVDQSRQQVSCEFAASSVRGFLLLHLGQFVEVECALARNSPATHDPAVDVAELRHASSYYLIKTLAALLIEQLLSRHDDDDAEGDAPSGAPEAGVFQPPQAMIVVVAKLHQLWMILTGYGACELVSTDLVWWLEAALFASSRLTTLLLSTAEVRHDNRSSLHGKCVDVVKEWLTTCAEWAKHMLRTLPPTSAVAESGMIISHYHCQLLVARCALMLPSAWYGWSSSSPELKDTLTVPRSSSCSLQTILEDVSVAKAQYASVVARCVDRVGEERLEADTSSLAQLRGGGGAAADVPSTWCMILSLEIRAKAWSIAVSWTASDAANGGSEAACNLRVSAEDEGGWPASAFAAVEGECDKIDALLRALAVDHTSSSAEQRLSAMEEVKTAIRQSQQRDALILSGPHGEDVCTTELSPTSLYYLRRVYATTCKYSTFLALAALAEHVNRGHPQVKETAADGTKSRARSLLFHSATALHAAQSRNDQLQIIVGLLIAAGRLERPSPGSCEASVKISEVGVPAEVSARVQHHLSWWQALLSEVQLSCLPPLLSDCLQDGNATEDATDEHQAAQLLWSLESIVVECWNHVCHFSHLGKVAAAECALWRAILFVFLPWVPECTPTRTAIDRQLTALC